MYKGKSLLVSLLFLIFLGMSIGWLRGTAQGASAIPATTADTPIVVSREALTDWLVSDGLLYWMYNCAIPTAEFRYPGYARRQPTTSPLVLTLATFTSDACINFRSPIADASGLYYYNGDASPKRIEFRPSGTPETPQTIYNTSDVSGAHIRLSGDYLYWIENGSRILRVRKNGTDFAEVANGLSDAIDLVVVDARQEVYWMEASGLWKTGLSCGTLPCSKSLQVNASNGGDLLLQNYQFGNFAIYWPEQSDGGKIRSFFCGTEFCTTSTPYQSPATATVTWGIGVPASDGNSLFWQEVGYDSTTFAYTARIRRLSNGIAQTIAENLDTISAYPVYIDQNTLYFYDVKRITGPQGIRKLPLAASTIARDLAVGAIEVTQGVQNLANNVPLVTEKPTYVQVQGAQLSGPNAFNVEATLSGTRNGVPLPGSPLRPIVQLPQFQTGAGFTRALQSRNWLFELPLSWRNGDIVLTVLADPRNAQSDPTLDNNTKSLSISFLNKAPLCVMLIPVRTNTPDLISTTIFDPIMPPTLELATRMMPMSELWPFYSFNPVEEWPGGQYAPFEMGEDNLGVLTAINTRAVFTSNPKVCKEIHAGTNYVGIVSQAGNMGNKYGGMGHLGLDSSWTALSQRLAPGQMAPFTPFWPNSGQIFAHELGHNFGRLHVDCGGPSGNDLFYPYDNSLFADGSANGYYGFDGRTKTSIKPLVGTSKIADLMSYCPPRWPSDYTWRAMMNKLSDRPLVNNASLPDQILAGSIVYVSGYISPTGGLGALDTAWVFDNSALGSDLFGKWQSLNANLVHQRIAHDHGVTGVHTDTFHLRLLDSANVVLSDQPITTVENDHHGGAETAKLFALTFAAPTGKVARLELLNSDTLLAVATPGSATPTVSIFTPTGGETISDKLQVSWRADDADSADKLLTTVQYSSDNGQSWQALLNNYLVKHGENNTVDIDPSSLTGSASNQALIRVSVSDGYNTTVANSKPFTMSNRKPFVTIFAPTQGAFVNPQETVSLRGIGVDPEEGGLAEAAHQWQVDGETLGNGKEMTVQGLAPGFHEVKLSAADSLAASSSATATVTVATLSVPLSSEQPVLDGLCDDSIYGDAAVIPLQLYDNQEQSYARLVRDADHLWVCFSGLLTDTGTINSSAILWVDVNDSNDSQAQSDDYRFVIDENGGVGTYAGDGIGGFSAVGPGGLQALVNFPMANYWNAEMRIDAASVGGWGHSVGLGASHNAVGATDTIHQWPRNAQSNQPASWGTTVLGTLAQISALEPMSATLGSAGVQLNITGENFDADAVVLWAGQPLSTTYVNSTTLQAVIDASKLTTATQIEVRVRNPNQVDSSSAIFVVEVPVPVLASLTPNSIQEGAAKFIVTLTGSDFLPGAKVIWNGEVLSATVVNRSQIEAEVSALLIKIATPVTVSVINPQPGGYTSNAADFAVEAIPVRKIFLPLVTKQ